MVAGCGEGVEGCGARGVAEQGLGQVVVGWVGGVGAVEEGEGHEGVEEEGDEELWMSLLLDGFERVFSRRVGL